MNECAKCKGNISGESGIQCAGVCGKIYHLAASCSGLDRTSSGILDRNEMIRFICEDCILYIHNVDLVLKDVQEAVKKNSNYLKEYKSEFEEALRKNEVEIKSLLEAIELRYTERLKAMKTAQETCERSVKEVRKITALSEAFKKQSEQICGEVKQITNQSEKVIESVKGMELSILNEQNKNISSLKSNIKKMSDNIVVNTKAQKSSYASVATYAVNKSDSVLLVRPKVLNGSAKAEKVVKSKLDPSSVKVSTLKSQKNGSVMIVCENEDSVEKLRKEVEDKLGDEYNAVVPALRKPRIKVVNFSEDYSTKENLLTQLKKQNEYLINCDIIVKRITKSKSKYDPYSAIIEIDSEMSKKVMSDGFVRLGWKKCRVFVAYYVKRCYKCLGFYHESSKCTAKMACAHCGEEHFYKNCDKIDVQKPNCVNCAHVNREYKLELPTDHNAFDRACGVFNKKLEKEKNKRI